MLRSMYAGISGMRNFQTKLDVVGNNIANVGTVGFKKGRVTFQDMLSQTTAGAQAPTATRGGVNPAQIGLGSQLGSIDNIHTQGFRQTTNNPLDFALEGDGMFIVRSGNAEYFTRAGNFYLDMNGSIVNPEGYYLLGFQAEETPGMQVQFDGISITFDMDGNVAELVVNNELVDYSGTIDDIALADGTQISITLDNNVVTSVEVSTDQDSAVEVPFSANNVYISSINEGQIGSLIIPDTAQSFSVQTNGIVNYIDENGIPRVAGQIALANFSNPAGLEKVGSNLFLNSPNAGYNGFVVPETEGAASVISGSLEMSNVDLAEEFTEMITAQRGFQANTRIITTSDEILQELVNLKR